MSLTFTRATKKALKARIALEGPSGSGKTYTALLTARALGKTIAVVDTERRSASLYADLFEFDTLQLDRYDPKVLIEALGAASGHDVVVIDSLSHFWMGQDGMLEQVDKAAKRSGGGNSFAGWKEMRPVERDMVDAMLAFPGHLIATLRTKTDYVVEQVNGKSVPKKVGLKPEQREGLEYEFTLVAAMDLENTLIVSKSRCPALAGAVIVRPTEEFGATLGAWLDSGESGITVADLREQALAARGDRNALLPIHTRAKQAGLLAAPIQGDGGASTTLGDFIVALGKEATATPPDVRERRLKRLFALWGQTEYAEDRDGRLAFTNHILDREDRPAASTKDLTDDEIERLIEHLERYIQQDGGPAA